MIFSAGKTDRMKIFGLTREENDELIKAENGSISIIEERLQPQPRIMPRKHQEIPSNQQTYCGCLGYVTKVILIFMVAMFLLLMLYGKIDVSSFLIFIIKKLILAEVLYYSLRKC